MTIARTSLWWYITTIMPLGSNRASSGGDVIAHKRSVLAVDDWEQSRMEKNLMKFKLISVMAVVVLLVICGAMAASAAAVLSADGMSMARGGCGVCGVPQKCPTASCGLTGSCTKCDDVYGDCYCDRGAFGQHCQPTPNSNGCGQWYSGTCFFFSCIGLSPTGIDCGGSTPVNWC